MTMTTEPRTTGLVAVAARLDPATNQVTMETRPLTDDDYRTTSGSAIALSSAERAWSIARQEVSNYVYSGSRSERWRGSMRDYSAQARNGAARRPNDWVSVDYGLMEERMVAPSFAVDEYYDDRTVMPDMITMDELSARDVHARMLQYMYGSGGVAMQAPAKVKKVDAPSRSMLKRVPVVLEDIDLKAEDAQLAADAEALLGYTPLRVHVGAPGRLRRALAKLEIDILDEKSVDKYKRQMVEHYRTHQKMSDPTWRLRSLRGCLDQVPKFALRKAVTIKRELPEAEFYVDQLAVDPFLLVALRPITDHWHNVKSRDLEPEMQAYIEVWDEPGFESA